MDVITISSTVLFSVALLLAYRRGISDGIRLSEGKPVEPVHSPAAAVREYKEKKEVKAGQGLIDEGIQNIFRYDPQEPQVK